MNTGRWVLAALAAALLVLWLMPVGLVARRQAGGNLWVWLRVGPLRFRLLPQRDRPPRRTRRGEAQAPAPPAPGAEADPDPPHPPPPAASPGDAPADPPPSGGEGDKGRRLPRIDWGEVKDALHALGPPALRALRRLRRGIRIEPLDVTVVLGGAADPAAAAVRWGRIQGAVWGLMPRIERVVKIPRPHLGIRLDMTREDTDVWGRAGLSLRVGTLLGIAAALALPAIRWLRERKRRPAAGKDDTHGHGKESAAA